MDHCPHCGISLVGESIPEEYIEAGYYGPATTHYRREIGVEVRGVYDGVLFWACPSCSGTWNRWNAEDGDRYTQAEEYMKRWRWSNDQRR